MTLTTAMSMAKITARMMIYGDVLTLHVKLMDLLPKGAARNQLLSNQQSITQVPTKLHHPSYYLRLNLSKYLTILRRKLGDTKSDCQKTRNTRSGEILA